MITNTDFVVLYSAMTDEIPIEQIPNFELIKDKPNFIIPPTHKIDPNEIAKNILNIFFTLTQKTNPHVLIFLPGQKFDLMGTRKGRGFGWYDKLLAELPNNWIRIGIATPSQISDTPLIRNPWDQPVNWLIFQKNENDWKIAETKNRPLTNDRDT